MLNTLSDSALLSEIKQVRFKERIAIADMILYLVEVESRKLYREAGCSSLFTYCREVLQYSEGGAYRRVQAAKVLLEERGVYEKLKDGSLSLCAVAEIGRVKEEEARRKLLREAEGKGKREVERLVAPLLPPEKLVSVKVKSVESLPLLSTEKREERYVVTMEVDREFMELYKKAQEFTSSVVPLTQVLKSALKEHVGKKETKRVTLPRTESETRRITKTIRNAVRVRDGNQCTYCVEGKRCTEKTGLEIDHVIPFSAGGTNTIQNLRLLCRAHNQLVAEQWYGKQFMDKKRVTSTVEVKV